MKKISIALCMASFIAVSCNKPLPDYSNKPFDFTISGMKDSIAVAANDFAYFTANINVLSGYPTVQPVTVAYNNIPANVFIKNNNASYKLNYTLQDSFAALNAAPGVYPMQAVFTGAAAGPKVYNFTLTITGPVNWMQKLVGYYYPEPKTLGNKIYVSCEIDSVAGSPGKIRIIDRVSHDRSFYGTFDTSYGWMDCCSGMFSIPSQTINGTTVEGNGYYIEKEGQRKWMLKRNYMSNAGTFSSIVMLRH
jgi:hypothetical protein